MIFSLEVRDIDATTHETNEYVQIFVYFSKLKNDKQILAQIIKKNPSDRRFKSKFVN